MVLSAPPVMSRVPVLSNVDLGKEGKKKKNKGEEEGGGGVPKKVDGRMERPRTKKEKKRKESERE